ncbi:MAG TPA: MBL fold metallo-hydrolase, partial [Chlamydiales bacterium]|nr:MBL fold metallo-hydrolase [Chlamydiales bacterium]
MIQAKLLFLGTGASTGIPVIGCPCHVCHSHNPKNKRLRTSALIQVNGKNYLIDAGPDIRRQALQYQMNTLDGLILTHSHFDHIGGLEELRIFNFIQHRPIDCILSDECYGDVQK